MKIVGWKQTDRKLSDKESDETKRRFLRSSRVGFEIEGDIGDAARECDNDYPACGICDNCPRCNNCIRCEFYCNQCDVPDDYRNCEHLNPDTLYCRYYDDRICDLCVEEDVRCGDCNPCQLCSDGGGISIGDVNRDIADELGVPAGKTDYDESRKEFQCVYNDGSVSTEVVTSALGIPQIKNTLTRAFAVMKNYNIKISPTVHAGGHQTYSFKGVFKPVVAKNIIQLVRYYFPALLSISCVNGSHYRSNTFRLLVDSSFKNDLPKWTKESCVNCKDSGAVASSLQLIEFRFPDAHTNINQTILSAVTNMSLISKAIEISSNGIAMFSQSHWGAVRTETNMFYEESKFAEYGFVEQLIDDLTEYLKPEISRYALFPSYEEAVRDIIDGDLVIENGNDIRKIILKEVI